MLFWRVSRIPVLLILGWFSWNSAHKTRKSWKFWIRILGAFTFMAGGWLLVGEIPTDEEVHWLTQQWTRRSNVPEHVFRILDHMPPNTHPMTQFVSAITAMQTESCFARRY